jgi:hypothetical protein
MRSWVKIEHIGLLSVHYFSLFRPPVHTQFCIIQGVPPGHEYLNVARIRLHFSMTFIWVYSVYSPLVAIHFLNRSIHSRKTACKLTFSMPSRTLSTDARNWSASSNERPARHLLTCSKRQKSDGARSGECGGCCAGFIWFSLNCWVDNLAVYGQALSACTNNFRSLPAALIERH